MKPFDGPLVNFADQLAAPPLTGPSQTSIGEIHIHISGEQKSPQEVALEVRKVLQAMSQAKFGTTSRWGEV